MKLLNEKNEIPISMLLVLHLLSVREHGDPHLRGACANLLAKLIQTTYDELRLLIHFLKNPFILHDLNNLELLLDIINLIFSSLSNHANDMNGIQSAEIIFHILSTFAGVVEDATNGKDPNNINHTNSMTSNKDSLITSNTDKDLKTRLNVTQFGIYGNNPSMMKFIGK
ncbi:unnamed protein product [Rotaria sp. Silwood1]|nr:unnamed protein product [Rotaria sp. Silwood1]CAF1582618.1 unnamed protein product [Rotaria sp. Silwood1]CAF3638662.1 unnamed protein product [Rotaria sp. Silwood1]CAF3666545.1 unnamed protein product [Rotaria sp. Silwood1]CAF3679326.1 unnamed protein product [Rotaria sp. Silwood1]